MTTLPSGTWSAVLNGADTVYQSGTTVVSAPVSLATGVTLIVTSGAIASNVTGSNQSTVNIASGGTLISSYLSNGYLNVSAGGISTANVLDSTLTYVFSGGASTGDTFNNASNAGVDTAVISSGGMVSNVTVQSGGSIQFQSGAIGNGVSLSSGGALNMADGSVSGLVVSKGAVATSNGVTYSGITISNQPDINTAVVLSGTWSAVLNNGVTLYQSGGVSYQWPVALAAGATLNVMSGAVAARISGTNQSTVNVASGGTLVSSYLNNGYLNVSAGGSSTTNTLDSTLTYILSGGSSVSDTWNNAGGMGMDYSIVSSGGVVVDPVIGSGGYLSGSVGATLSNVYVSSGGSFSTVAPIGGSVTIPDFMQVAPGASVMSGTWIATVQNSKTVYQSGGVTLVDPVALASGGNLTIQSGAIVSHLSTGQGAVVTVASGTLVSSYIDNGIVYVSSGGITSGNAFNSTWSITSSGGASIGDTWFASGAGRTLETSYIYSGATMTDGSVGSGATMVVNSGGVTRDPSVANGGTLTIQNQGTNGCFLAGTLIRTPEGEVAVEELAIGDTVISLEDGCEISRPVTWIGVSRNSFSPKQPLDLAGYPVRVRQNAFGEAMPSQDLLVTAEHCFVFEGAFIPVRMLVNGSSIHYDQSITDYNYYHIELERHSVIVSNNVATESYLNTGNRRYFSSGHNIVSLHEETKAWNRDSALPLSVTRDAVEKIHQSLALRAGELGLASEETSSFLTDDPALCLGLPDGRIIAPMRQTGGAYIFSVPSGVREATLISRQSRPCDVIGPFLDDRRLLGVLVGEMTLFGSRQTLDLTDHLREGVVQGWHPVEMPGCRWTTGAGCIALPREKGDSNAILSVEILQAGPYRMGALDGPDHQTPAHQAA